MTQLAKLRHKHLTKERAALCKELRHYQLQVEVLDQKIAEIDLELASWHPPTEAPTGRIRLADVVGGKIRLPKKPLPCWESRFFIIASGTEVHPPGGRLWARLPGQEALQKLKTWQEILQNGWKLEPTETRAPREFPWVYPSGTTRWFMLEEIEMEF